MKKNKKKQNNKFFSFMGIVLIITSLILLGLLLYLNILPSLYLILISTVVLFFDLILGFFLLHGRVKRTLKLKTLLISIILILVYVLGSSYLFKTMNFLSIITGSSNKIINYLVVVNSNSNYNDIEQLRNKKVGYYELNKDVNDKINVKVDFDAYKSFNNMYTDLLKNKLDAFLIEESLSKMLEENNENYNKNTKVIYKFSIKVEMDSTLKQVNVTKQSFNIYLSGIDTYGDIAETSRSDVNMIVTINPQTGTILLTSIPRDYYVRLHNKTGYKDKLTHAGIYGVDTSINTIEDLLDIDINYYIKVNFTSVVDIVNILGGVTVNSDYAFTSFDNYHYQKGENTLYGEKALSFVRERHAFADGDRQRGKNQAALIRAIIDKATSPSIITKYDSLLSSVSNKIQTNIPQKDMLSLLKYQLSNNPKWNIISNSLDGTNGSEYTYTYSATKLYVMIPDEESINNAKEMIQKVGDGVELQ